MEAYCVKCKTKRELMDPQPLFNARGAAFTRGFCPVCSTTLTRLGKTELHAGVDRESMVAEASNKQRKDQAAENFPGPPSATSRPKKQTEPKLKVKTDQVRGRTKTRVTSKKPREGAPNFSFDSSVRPLVIVESPAKAKTIGKFLGRDYVVRASVGHVRDLPERQLGVDIEKRFKPHYVIAKKKKKVVDELKEYAKHSSQIFLATDPDREGEAIAWHLVEALGNTIRDKPTRRVEFHEITREAIGDAFAHPREIDMDRVDSQQARRILDRIVGYKISPLLRKKLTRNGLSAGRVQSVALRLVVEREREIQNFVAVEYWSIEAELRKSEAGPLAAFGKGEALDSRRPESATFRAKLIKVGDKDFECHVGEEAFKLKDVLEKCSYVVLDVRRKDVTRNPAPPFITSTLQQEASRKLGMNPKRTMSVAQQLYEGLQIGEEGSVGLITYMRTDSTNVAESAQKEAWAFIKEKFGDVFLPKFPRKYSKKVAGAQEAHEAIRPTKTFREPAIIRQYLDHDQYRLYDLIWKRFVASQMASAILDTTAVDVGAFEANHPGGLVPDYLFRANGSVIKFEGFLRVYDEGTDGKAEEGEGKRLPVLAARDPLDLLGIYPEQHFTEPPPRYTEATLVKALEQHGIGRPSTYAPIMANIQERGYIEQIEARRLKPTELGFVLSDLLVAHFGDIMNVGFTARMEESLDDVAAGKSEWVQIMSDFYGPFSSTLERADKEMPVTKFAEQLTDIACAECGAQMVIKNGRFGKFLACSKYPLQHPTRSITTGVKCPECGRGELAKRKSKRGKIFYSCSRYPECKFATWDEPLGLPCPKCGGLLTAKGNAVKCVRGDFTGDRSKLAIPEQTKISAG